MTHTKIEKIKELKTNYDQAISELVDYLRGNFAELFAPIFQEFPNLKNFTWYQYTPYFNDGDTCYFSVHFDIESLMLNGKTYYEIDEEESEQLLKAFEIRAGKISNILENLPEDVLLELFGDHSQITVSHNGNVDVEGYVHD